MPVLTFRDVSLSLGHQPLLDRVSFQVERGERVCLVGRNGAGKTTLFRLVSGEMLPDGGEIGRGAGLRVAQLVQDVPRGVAGRVFHVVAEGLGGSAVLVERYHALTRRLAAGDDTALAALEHCQHELEAAGGWALEQRVEAVLSRLDLDPEADLASLSGGLKRRVLLARALVADPELLLLDEPTNHLDIDGILWLEEFLLGWGGALLFITHDRAFLRRLATRILELDRGRLTDFPGDYPTYLARKAALLEAEETRNALFDAKLAREEVWIRQGIKARRTRNEGRVRALERMRRERAVRREAGGSVRMDIQTADRSGTLVVEAREVGFRYGDRPVVRGLNTTILRGDKVGIIGPNGAGKTTLLRLLIGELEPGEGRIRRGTRLEIAYFDQYRAVLDPEQTVQDSVGEGRDNVTINGRSRHVLSYLQDFLFTPERARQPVKALSGGERNRLLLARLFTRPANLLVLDEPTNDLDADTLDLLEDLLVEYAGTVLLVSHDRSFLNHVVTSTLVFEGDGVVREYVGGYDDWLRQRPLPGPREGPPGSLPAGAGGRAGTPGAGVRDARPGTGGGAAPGGVAGAPKSGSGVPNAGRARRLSFREQQELAGLPGRIEALESEREALLAAMSAPAFYQGDKNDITRANARLSEIDGALAKAFVRWEELEAG